MRIIISRQARFDGKKGICKKCVLRLDCICGNVTFLECVRERLKEHLKDTKVGWRNEA